jgi:hypothetical protein
MLERLPKNQPLKHLFHKKEDNRTAIGEFESQAHHIAHKRPPGRLERFSAFFPSQQFASQRPHESPHKHAPGWKEKHANEHAHHRDPDAQLRCPVFSGPNHRNHIVQDGDQYGQAPHNKQEGWTKWLPILGKREKYQGQKTDGRPRDDGKNTPHNTSKCTKEPQDDQCYGQIYSPFGLYAVDIKSKPTTPGKEIKGRGPSNFRIKTEIIDCPALLINQQGIRCNRPQACTHEGECLIDTLWPLFYTFLV